MNDVDAYQAADVFKIMPASLWDAAVASGQFTGSPDDVRDGFIHLSAADQIEDTLAKHFRNQDDLIIVAFNSAQLGSSLKWEVSRGGALFPHVYGALPVDFALWQQRLTLGADGIPKFVKDPI